MEKWSHKINTTKVIFQKHEQKHSFFGLIWLMYLFVYFALQLFLFICPFPFYYQAPFNHSWNTHVHTSVDFSVTKAYISKLHGILVLLIAEPIGSVVFPQVARNHWDDFLLLFYFLPCRSLKTDTDNAGIDSKCFFTL